MANIRVPSNLPINNINIKNKSLVIQDMKFQVEVHGMKLNTVGLSSSPGVFYMTDKFQQGNTIRSFQMYNLTSDNPSVMTINEVNFFGVIWDNLNYCSPHTVKTTTAILMIERDGTIRFGMDYIPLKSPQCNVTVEIADAIYNGSADGNGEMISGKPIHRIVLNSLLLADDLHLRITLVPRCPVQTLYNACIAESLANGKCVWCSKYEKCVYENSTPWNSLIPSDAEIVNASQCIVAETHSPGSNSVYYIPVIVVGILIVVAFTVWFILRKYNK
ncbi:hypothetical protein MN116_008819 [Schistosoma mekongi]|uniref:Uncharacterized protein n=1 Tax=Schistosoma mekongi TaxID=38744 RepID=A0AAE2D1T7_SCHME|nr:hypothetical protein MN116_008819 [Schistosoma mekongi]